jgi:hypothetical protein
LTVAECEEVFTSVFRQPNGLRWTASSMDSALYQWDAFPWQTTAYDGVIDGTMPQRVRRFSRAYWRQRLAAEASPTPPVREIRVDFDRRLLPPRARTATGAQVDLTEHYTGLLSDPLYPPFSQDHQDNDLANLPPGLSQFGGVRFDIRGVVRLRAAHPKGRPWTVIWAQHPAGSEGIKVGERFGRIHVLHGASGGWLHALGGAREPVPDDTPIARFTFHYVDGRQYIQEVVYGRDVRDWWEGAGDQWAIDQGEVAWRGANPVAERYGAKLRLYRTTWTNPHPQTLVTHLDYESLLTGCGPFLLAITVE